MEGFIKQLHAQELVQTPNPLVAAERVLAGRGDKLLSEEIMSFLLPLPYTSAEDAHQDMAFLLLQKLLVPYL